MKALVGSDSGLSDRFKSVLETFCSLAARDGLTIVPYQGSGPTYFNRLPVADQLAILENFERYSEVCADVVRAGESPSQGSQFLWRMFLRLGVRPVSQLMDHLGADDVIEIYNASFVQVFRSLSFFRICSYTLDDLLCRPFWELFRRDEALFGSMVETSRGALAGKVEGVHHWNVAVHTVDEIESMARYRAVVQYKLLSPLYDAQGGVVALVNVFRPISCVSTLTPVAEPVKFEGAYENR